jgi:Ca2+-binding EF-hand superfamily protein
MRDAFRATSQSLSDKDIQKIIQKLDFVGNKKINYTEFLVATIDRKVLKKTDLIKDLFKQFDA